MTSEARRRLNSFSADVHPEQIAQKYDIDLPKNWNQYSHGLKLEFIADRILAKSRTTKKHTVMREEGFLSRSQIKYRSLREVVSDLVHGLDEITPERGVAGRAQARLASRKPKSSAYLLHEEKENLQYRN